MHLKCQKIEKHEIDEIAPKFDDNWCRVSSDHSLSIDMTSGAKTPLAERQNSKSLHYFTFSNFSGPLMEF